MQEIPAFCRENDRTKGTLGRWLKKKLQEFPEALDSEELL